MEWLKELLKNAGVENVDDLEEKISKELPKYFKPAKEFNDINEELKLVKGEYDITKIEETTIPYSVETVSANGSSSNSSILPTKEDVNRNTTKYSMQKSESNSFYYYLK